MPIIHQEKGYKIYIYSSDHNPPHCHFHKGGEVAVVQLQPLKITHYSSGLKGDLREIRKIAERHHEKLLQAWYDIVDR